MNRPATPRHFGFWTLAFLVVGNMIGAGVFTTSGYALADLREPFVVVLAWLVGGGLAVAGARSYGELVRVWPESGGEYTFLSRAGFPWLGFLAGWVSLLAGFTGALALAATVLESYAVPSASRPDWLPENLVAIGAIGLSALLHGIVVRAGAAVQNLAVVIKLVLLFGFLIVAGWLSKQHPWHIESLSAPDQSRWQQVAHFAGSLIWISLAYSGFNAAVYVADEVETARDRVGPAMLTATLLVTLLYVALNGVFVTAAPPNELAGEPDVAAVAARALGGPILEWAVRLTILLALATSVSSLTMAGPRVFAKMAEDGWLPEWLRIRDRLPRNAVTIQAMLAIFLVLNSTSRQLLTYLGLTLSLSAAVTVACLWHPRLQRQRDNPGARWARVIFVVGTMAVAATQAIADPKQCYGTAATVLSGTLIYWYLSSRSARSA